MNEKELIPIKTKISLIAQEVKNIDITDSISMKRAVEVLSQMNRYSDTVKTKKEELTKPINITLKNIRLMFKPVEEIYDESISILRKKMSDYQTAELKTREEEALRIANRVGEGKGKLKVETAINKIESLDKPEEAVSTDSGTVKFRTVKELEITDETLIPRKYLVVDERLLTNDLKNGHTIPGASLRERQVPINYR